MNSALRTCEYVTLLQYVTHVHTSRLILVERWPFCVALIAKKRRVQVTSLNLHVADNICIVAPVTEIAAEVAAAEISAVVTSAHDDVIMSHSRVPLHFITK
jgi:hypothetical protein